jgi:hypothetical protein
MRTYRERAVDRALSFRQCPDCSFDFITGEGERSCHYGDCPYRPDEIDVLCPQCRYNFFTGEGSPACGTRPACEFARTEAPDRVDLARRWLDAHG